MRPSSVVVGTASRPRSEFAITSLTMTSANWPIRLSGATKFR
jgi:hypothetical protein